MLLLLLLLLLCFLSALCSSRTVCQRTETKALFPPMPLRLLRDQILVKPIGWHQSRTLEVISNDRYSRAIVIAVGPGEPILDKHKRVKRIREMEVKPGDYIVYGFDHIFPKYSENGTEYRILQDKDVCFISDPDFIDAHAQLTDGEIDNLIQLHRFANRGLEIRV